MKIWYIWVIISILMFIAEIIVPTFVFFSLGIGCLASALASAFGVGLIWGIIVFVITALVVFFGLKPLFFKFLYPKHGEIKTNVDALIGKIGVVSETIVPDCNKGRVIVGGEDWKAVSIDDEPIDKGQKVIIMKIEGVKLFVKLKSKGKEEQK